MAKYLIKASYGPEGIKGVIAKGGTARVDAVGKLIAEAGGSMESFYFAFGGDDVFVTVDVPSHEAMVAIAGAVTSTGVLSRYETIVLLTAEQIDDAAHLKIAYTPPGG